MQSTDTTQDSNLRVLLLTQAEIQRLKALLAAEITTLEAGVSNDKFCAKNLISFSKNYEKDYQEEIIYRYNRAASKQRKINNLSKIQHALKYEAWKPEDFAYACVEDIYG